MRLRLLLSLLLVAALSACGEGDDGDPSEPQPTVTVTVTETETVAPEETEGPTATETPDDAAGDPCAEIEPIGAELAFIVVASPTPGAVLEPGGTVQGCGNTFEAGYQWELLDGQGNELAGDFGTMTCGSGCHGEFSFEVDYTVDEEQIGTLRVFETSAQDGSDVHVNAIPVRLQP